MAFVTDQPAGFFSSAADLHSASQVQSFRKCPGSPHRLQLNVFLLAGFDDLSSLLLLTAVKELFEIVEAAALFLL